MNKIVLSLVLVFSFTGIFSQSDNLKTNALEEFKKEHYKEAISILEQALKLSPDDPEIYYYLGFFNHYMAYDSRPLNGYNFNHSEKIFSYLEKAIELNPDYGNAKYFYGAECSANAFLAMQNYDLEKLKYYYKQAERKGAYPDWLKEFGRNMLNQCEKDAIFFAGGNADFDICTYLQLHEEFRTDVTVIPIGNIDRPWYVKFLKLGLKDGVRAINLNLAKNQIDDIHPFKWDTTVVEIPLSDKIRKAYGLDSKYKMQWTVNPDLFSNRRHVKISGEIPKNRTYLSPQKAMLIQIVEDNLSQRAIYFSNMANPFFHGGLEQFFQDHGLVSKLLPIQTENTKYAIDYSKLETLLTGDHLKNVKKVKEEDIPRISEIIYAYHNTVLTLAAHYHETQNKTKLKTLYDIYIKKLKVGFNPDYESIIQEELRRMLE